MSTGRTLAVVLLSVLLTITLFGATVATGVERTALDDQYVAEQFEDEQVDAKIGGELRGEIATKIDRSDEQREVPTGISIDLDGETVANRTVTDEFVAGELSRNIEIGLRYLRGETEELDLRTNLREIKASIRAEIIDGTTVDTPQLVGANTDRIGAERIAMLSEGEQEYQEAQLDLSDEERAELEAEIETNVKQQLSNTSDELVGAILDHQYTVLDGLTGELTHEEYVEQLAADEQRIKAAIGDAALAEVPDEQSLVSEDDDPESTLGPVRTGASLTVTLAWLLPLLAAGLLAVVYGVSRSVDRTATVGGTGFLVAGILGAVLGFLAGPALKGTVGVGSEESDPIIEGMVAVIDGTLQTVGTQSLVVALVGFVVLVAVVADRRGLFDGVRSRLNLDPRANSR
ncbi:hypothetical protein [Halovenus sp. HT40]|uniref:hypothetical protein n=1 Tax=Halovenus sp. HT40 TaxID=3126691 RepID=UPI00300EA1C0